MDPLFFFLGFLGISWPPWLATKVPGVNEQVFHCWADDAADCNRSLDLQDGDRLLSFQDVKVTGAAWN